MRAVSVAFSLDLPSRRKNEPGILPAAYMRSSTSTVSGRKSTSRRPPMVAVLRTIVSPWLTTTAPPACFASLPVSKEIVLSPTSTVTRVTLNLLIRIFTSGRPDGSHRFQNSRSRSLDRLQARTRGGFALFAGLRASRLAEWARSGTWSGSPDWSPPWSREAIRQGRHPRVAFNLVAYDRARNVGRAG